jgi:hypothetical protein
MGVLYMAATRASVQYIIDSALAELGVQSGIVGVANQEQNVTQALALLQSLGRDSVNVHDWQFLMKTAAYTGDGVETAFDMPSDFGRIVNQTEWALNNKRPMIGPLSPQQWGWTQYGIVSVGVYFRYRILDDDFTIFPVPGVGELFAFYYISKNWLVDSSNEPKNVITSGTDIVLFDDRLMISGLKMRFWGAKGYDTTALANEFNYQLQAQKGQDQGAPVIQLSGTDGFHYIDASNVPDGSWGV